MRRPPKSCRGGGIGRHTRLRGVFPNGSAGSSPAHGTHNSCIRQSLRILPLVWIILHGADSRQRILPACPCQHHHPASNNGTRHRIVATYDRPQIAHVTRGSPRLFLLPNVDSSRAGFPPKERAPLISPYLFPLTIRITSPMWAHTRTGTAHCIMGTERATLRGGWQFVGEW